VKTSDTVETTSSEPEIILLPKEMQDYWPSLIEPSDVPWPKHEPGSEAEMAGPGVPGAAISADELVMHMNDMKEFMNLVLKIAFNHLHLYKHSQDAKSRFDQLFAKQAGETGDFGENIRNYVDEFVHNTPMGD
jgi:hypothetical protein